jgi:lipoprotein NlpI
MKYFSIYIFISILLSSNICSAQDDAKAQKAVQNYLAAKYSNYKPHSFGELFIQFYPDAIQKQIKTTRKIKYSMTHSYYLGNKIIKDEYFHLDSNYTVLGQLSEASMMELTTNILPEVLSDTLTATSDSLSVPDPEEFEFATGIAYMQVENYSGAIKSFSKVIDAHPTDGTTYYYRGQCYLKLKDKKSACTDFQKSKNLGYVDIQLDEYLKKCGGK